MKKLVLVAAVAAATIVPSVASAHTLGGTDARRAAQRVCTQINNVSADVNPYVCRRVGTPRRRSPHVIDIALALRDPNDGETCTAYIRVRLSTTSNRYRAFRHRHTCGADPFAGL